jgi:hypothetical protein
MRNQTIEGGDRCGFSLPRNGIANRKLISATKQGQALFKGNGDGHGLEYRLRDRGGDHLVSRSMVERGRAKKVTSDAKKGGGGTLRVGARTKDAKEHKGSLIRSSYPLCTVVTVV